METTKVFANTFRDMMRAKLQLFFHRSLYRYAIGAVAAIMDTSGNICGLWERAGE